MSRERLLKDMVQVSDYLDDKGLSKEAAAMDNIIAKVAGKSKDGGTGDTGAALDMIARFEERFDKFARRIEGQTSIRAIREAGKDTRSVHVIMDKMAKCIGELKEHLGK